MYSHFPGQKWQLKGIISAADKRKQEGNGGRGLEADKTELATSAKASIHSHNQWKNFMKYFSPTIY